jgi:hypothetical protein
MRRWFTRSWYLEDYLIVIFAGLIVGLLIGNVWPW